MRLLSIIKSKISPNMAIVAIELFVFMVLCFIVNYFHLVKNAEMVEKMTSLSENLFELNGSIVIALIIAMVMGDAFIDKGRKMKRIARGVWIVIILNSLVLASYPIWGIYGVAVVVSAFLANIIRISYSLKAMYD